MLQTENAESAHCSSSSGLGLRENLLADILPAISQARDTSETEAAENKITAKDEIDQIFFRRLKILLQSNSDLRLKLVKYFKNSNSAKKLLLGYIEPRAKATVRIFIEETFLAGGRLAN